MTTFPRRLRPFLCGFGMFAIVVSLTPEPVRADETSKVALINEMFEVTHADTLMQQTMKQMEAAQKAQFAKVEPFKSKPELADKIWTKMYALIADRLSWDKLKPEMIKLYADTFTEEELAAAVNFYKSPAGEAMMKKLPIVMNGAMTLTQQKMGDLMPDIQRIVREAMGEETDDADSKPKDE